MINIKDNLAHIEQEILQAFLLADRARNQVTLLAVSKTKPAEQITLAYEAGQRQFGESYIQEAVDKIEQLQHLPDITWHFIGPIQSNKTKFIASHFSWVHSIDRVKVAQRLNNQRDTEDTPLNVCLQVNISEEETKSGIALSDLAELADAVANAENLTLRGLMAIPEKNASKDSFNTMLELFKQYQQRYPSIDTLSMGMSADLEPAIKAGSTMVRIGSAIFGNRT